MLEIFIVTGVVCFLGGVFLGGIAVQGKEEELKQPYTKERRPW